jgi:rhodanese-related sulfurtransferase
VTTEASKRHDSIDAATLRRWRAENTSLRLLDVRTSSEFENARIAGAVNVPLSQLKRHRADIVSGLDGDRVVVLCQSGPRSEQASKLLAEQGYTGAVVLKGGVNAWAAAAGELEQGQPKWAMERQVRLTAGALVLTGIVGSLRFPKLRFLSGAVGAGLTFAAATNTCAMSRVLGLLPYNRGSRADLDRAVADLTGR